MVGPVIDPERFLEFTFFRGRVALAAALRALGIGRGDYVAIQAFTCVAVPEAVIAVGATPVYVDIDPATLGMSPESLQSRLDSKVRAVVVQHTFGVPADIARLADIARSAGIPLIEDCCHTLFSSVDGRLVGSFGVATFYSWEWGKPIIAGTGGSLVVNDSTLRDRVTGIYSEFAEPSKLRQLRISLQRFVHGVLYRPALYQQIRRLYRLTSDLKLVEGSYNTLDPQKVSSDFAMRMGKRQSARLAVELQNVESDVSMRRELAGVYRRALQTTSVRLLPQMSGREAVMARYPVLVDDKAAALARASERGMELSGWYETVVHPLAGGDLRLMSYEVGSCPYAERAAGEIVTLPINKRVTTRDVERAGDLFH